MLALFSQPPPSLSQNLQNLQVVPQALLPHSRPKKLAKMEEATSWERGSDQQVGVKEKKRHLPGETEAVLEEIRQSF